MCVCVCVCVCERERECVFVDISLYASQETTNIDVYLHVQRIPTLRTCTYVCKVEQCSSCVPLDSRVTDSRKC